MTETEYLQRAQATLNRLELALDAVEGPLDHERVADGILEIEFEDGGKIIVNQQSAAREIWVAAKSGGFHYRWDGDAWRDTRGGEELFAALSALISAQAGEPVTLV